MSRDKMKEKDHKETTIEENKEPVTLDKNKIDQVLDSFIREQEQAKEREIKRQESIEKQKRARKMARALSFASLALFVLIIIALNPSTQKYYKNYKQSQIPREEYLIEYNYSPGMEILPMGENILLYDSNNLRVLRKNGEEVFDIPFNIGSWDLASSDKNIYLLDKIENILYFIDESGSFISKAELNNIPHRLYSGKSGNLALHYKSESGVEGVSIFDKSGKALADTTYPKTTITMVYVGDDNRVTVHGMHRTASVMENSVYRYSDKGNLIFSKAYEDVVFIRQYEDKSSIAYVDVNKVQFYNKNINEDENAVSSIIPSKLMAFDPDDSLLYLLDKRHRLRILDMQGNLVKERHFQTEYENLIIYKGEMLLVGDDFIRTSFRDIKMNKNIEDLFILGDYLVIATKGELKLINKLD